jgi:peptide/nickel transport system ATP-binding protein
MPDEKIPILSGRGLTKVFGLGRHKTVAVDHVDFNFYTGEIISIVGESGSGKTTLAKMLLGLISHTEGEIYYHEQKRDISTHKKKQEYWKGIQAIFQDPFSSYNIFHKIDAVLLDCIRMRGGGGLPKEKKVELMAEACSFVNLKFEELTNKYPFELSGGQMQRLMNCPPSPPRPMILNLPAPHAPLPPLQPPHVRPPQPPLPRPAPQAQDPAGRRTHIDDRRLLARHHPGHADETAQRNRHDADLHHPRHRPGLLRL